MAGGLVEMRKVVDVTTVSIVQRGKKAQADQLRFDWRQRTQNISNDLLNEF